MTSADLSALVLQIIDLKREIASREKLLDQANLILIDQAQLALKEDGHKTFVGCKYTFTADDGSLARVSFPEDQVIREFRFDDVGRPFRTKGSGAKAEHIAMPGLKAAAGAHFENLFITVFKPAPKCFRELVQRLCGKASQEKLLELCTEPSSPRVTTEVAEVVP